MVVCGERRFADDQSDTFLNPTLIVEVLSKSTESYDRGKKFEYYRGIESLAEYVTISQDRSHVEHWTRQPDNRWLLEDSDSLEDVLRLSSIGCDLSLAEIYEGIEFPELPPEEGLLEAESDTE
jgi:Uma2 family endonuclease